MTSVRRAAVRPARRDRADLSADRGQFQSGATRSSSSRRCGGARRHRVDAVRDRHDALVPALTARSCALALHANSVLVISFARERLADWAIRCRPRSRPVSCASARADDRSCHDHRMAHGLGLAKAANECPLAAPSSVASCCNDATLLFVPVVFSILHGREAVASPPRLDNACRLSPLRLSSRAGACASPIVWSSSPPSWWSRRDDAPHADARLSEWAEARSADRRGCDPRPARQADHDRSSRPARGFFAGTALLTRRRYLKEWKADIARR